MWNRPKSTCPVIRLIRSWQRTAGQIGSEDNFRVADHPGVIAWWLESKCRVRLLLRVARLSGGPINLWGREDSRIIWTSIDGLLRREYIVRSRFFPGGPNPSFIVRRLLWKS